MRALTFLYFVLSMLGLFTGRTPISFRVQPGDSIHVGKSSQVGKKVSKKLNMDKKQPESQSSTITSVSLKKNRIKIFYIQVLPMIFIILSKSTI